MSRIQRLLAPPSGPEVMGVRESNLYPGVLAVTTDIRFYSNVLNATHCLSWRTTWARWLDRAIEIYRPESMPIVVYDINMPGVAWGQAFARLNTLPNHPRIFLAATRIDEELWSEVLRRHGYDTVERSAGSEELSRVFRFAWLSLHAPATV